MGQLPAFADSVASGEIANSFGKNLGWSDARTVRFKAFLQGHRSDIESAKQTVQLSALKMVSAVFVIPILAIFFLSDGERFANQLILLIPTTSDGSAARSLVADLNVMLQRYIRAKVILGILSFLFSSVALLALGFPHWLALGAVAGILEFIPIAGWIMAATTITTVDYIVQRLADEGITDCFGVPGDYAFPVCDAVDRNPNIRWVGCSNELNASYAADG